MRTFSPVALIDEPNCIGCARCLEVCPTDAIVGAPQQMHTVIASDCTGCERCLPVCPTDCIAMAPRRNETAPPVAVATRWRARYRARKARLARELCCEQGARARKLAAGGDILAAVLARAKADRARKGPRR